MRSPEDIAVVALTDHHEAFGKPMATLPEHILILPWLTGYTAQATNRMHTAVSGSGAITATVSHLGSEDGPFVRGDDLHDLQRILDEKALQTDTRYADTTPGQDVLPPILTLRGGHVRKPGERILVRELSIVSLVLGGLVIRKNIALGARSEA